MKYDFYFAILSRNAKEDQTGGVQEERQDIERKPHFDEQLSVKLLNIKKFKLARIHCAWRAYKSNFARNFEYYVPLVASCIFLHSNRAFTYSDLFHVHSRYYLSCRFEFEEWKILILTWLEFFNSQVEISIDSR